MNSSANSLPVIRKENCTRYRYRYSTCSRCADQCPHLAITLSDMGVNVDVEKCTGCALCAASCPTNVFHAKNLPLSSIARPDGDSVSVSCHLSELTGDIRVPCLGAIDTALLASLSLRGILVTLRGSGHCEQCPNAPQGGQSLQAILDGVKAVVSTISDSTYPLPILADEAENSGLDHRRAERRQLFRRWMARVNDNPKVGDKPINEIPARAIRYAAHSVPARRRLAEKILHKLDKSFNDEVIGLTWAVASVEIGDKGCTGCEACARVCPTGALKISEEDDEWKLVTSASKCVGCGVCIESCTVNAITLQQGWQKTKSEPFELHALRRHRCQACGRYFIGIVDNTCPVCSDDADSFSAIFG